MFKVLGVVLVVLAIFAAVFPMFTDCQSQGKAITLANGKTIPMKCHWSGVAEIAAAAPLAVVGVMMTFNRRKTTLMQLGGLGVVLGAVIIALPTFLIGVCQTPTMTCVTLERPGLITAGALVIASGLVGMVLAARSNRLE
ncbi:DUF4418 family protein [Dehalogenimonas sp. 4OHTPN]|uniref:DUF4418 family protein n=1 Tax=Dehalogenimonas sp. 4OHTPN TaxID=3166643 RepID=A0AAU8GAC4_9CHLR